MNYEDLPPKTYKLKEYITIEDNDEYISSLHKEITLPRHPDYNDILTTNEIINELKNENDFQINEFQKSFYNINLEKLKNKEYLTNKNCGTLKRKNSYNKDYNAKRILLSDVNKEISSIKNIQSTSNIKNLSFINDNNNELLINTLFKNYNENFLFNNNISEPFIPQLDNMFMRGTTTLGFIYPGGVILATDSRATAGDLIVTQKLNKIIAINDIILCTLAGNAGDCVYWLNVLSKECKIYEEKYKSKMNIQHAANLMINMIRKYKDSNKQKITNGLTFGILMASYDLELGAKLYMLNNCGLLLEGNKFCVGSGAEYAQAIVDTEYHTELTEEQAFELATSAIYYACRRDIHSGGYVRVYKITPNGWNLVSNKDVNQIYHGLT